MKHIQRRDPTHILTKAKHLFDAKVKAFAESRVRNSLIVFALSVLTGYHSSANEANVPTDCAREGLKTSQLGMRVWVEKSARRLNVDSNGVILKGYDPVAYFTQKKAVKGSSKYQSTYQGATYYFNSAADLAIFKKNPSKYVPQYGGFCANGVKNNRLTEADPTVFFIIKGKLYVCESPAAAKEFRANEDEDIVTANRNWYQLNH